MSLLASSVVLRSVSGLLYESCKHKGVGEVDYFIAHALTVDMGISGMSGISKLCCAVLILLKACS